MIRLDTAFSDDRQPRSRCADAAGGEDQVRAVSLPHRPEASRQARRTTLETLAAWRVDRRTADKVLLVVSELVTNAVEHARPPLSLRLIRDPDTGQVRVEVADGGPARRQGDWAASGMPAEHGRGLRIIDEVAAAHGERRADHHAVHWADLTTAA
ncbi:ATP-binding protein [Streptantibioticus cattleyicolor]|nr:ATP-binding protein [Streptantibioticus cattleyicolor]